MTMYINGHIMKNLHLQKEALDMKKDFQKQQVRKS